MIFDDWLDARTHIEHCADKAGLYALAGLIRENPTEEEFLLFCKKFEGVAREINTVDWLAGDAPEAMRKELNADEPVETRAHEEDCPALDGFGCRCGENGRDEPNVKVSD